MRLLFLLFPIFLFGQETIIHTDDFTKNLHIEVEPYKTTGFDIIGSHCKEFGSLFSYELIKSPSGEIVMKFKLFISTLNPICFSKSDSSITFLFDDDTQLKLNCIDQLRCERIQTVDFLLKESDLLYLCSHIPKKIRVVATDGYIDGTIKQNKLSIIIKTLAEFKKQFILAKDN